MRKRLAVIALAALSILGVRAVVSGGQTQESPYKDLIGIWDVQTEDGQRTFIFTFSVENGELKGVFTGQLGEFKMENLKVEDGKVTFLVNLSTGGQEMPINFAVIVAGESLTGMLSLQFGESDIVGRKKK